MNNEDVIFSDSELSSDSSEYEETEVFENLSEYEDGKDSAAEIEDSKAEDVSGNDSESEESEFSGSDNTSENEDNSDDPGGINETENTTTASLYDYSSDLNDLKNFEAVYISLMLGLVLGLCFVKGFNK